MIPQKFETEAFQKKLENLKKKTELLQSITEVNNKRHQTQKRKQNFMNYRPSYEICKKIKVLENQSTYISSMNLAATMTLVISKR